MLSGTKQKMFHGYYCVHGQDSHWGRSSSSHLFFRERHWIHVFEWCKQWVSAGDLPTDSPLQSIMGTKENAKIGHVSFSLGGSSGGDLLWKYKTKNSMLILTSATRAHAQTQLPSDVDTGQTPPWLVEPSKVSQFSQFFSPRLPFL